MGVSTVRKGILEKRTKALHLFAHVALVLLSGAPAEDAAEDVEEDGVDDEAATTAIEEDLGAVEGKEPDPPRGSRQLLTLAANLKLRSVCSKWALRGEIWTTNSILVLLPSTNVL